MDLGWPFPQRIKHLQDLLATTTGHTRGIRFQNRLQYFQIYPVPIGLPKYRLENGRTSAAQLEYLAKHPEIASDIFTKDPESEVAQALQHDILKMMVGESGLFDYFEDHDQEIPLILTSQGFVVNGNRRLCAMREHYESDKAKFKRFQHVDIVILPPCDQRDIDWLEGKEQIQRDITAKYPWYGTAIMYKQRMAEHHFSVAELASLYEAKEADVKELLDMLSYAELYLKDRGKEGQYSALAGDEYAFRQLKKNRPRLKSEEKKEVYEKLCYTLIDNPQGDRSYQVVADVAKHFDRVIAELRTEFAVPEESQVTPNAILGGEDSTLSGIESIIDQTNNHDRVREVIRDVIDAETQRGKDQKKNNVVLAQVKKASAALKDAEASIGATSSKEGIAPLLDDVEASTKVIRAWIDAKP